MRFTDMADEMFGAAQGALPAGVRLATAKRGGVTITRVEIAREGLAKPRGRYVTLEMPSVSVLDERDAAVIETCAAELQALLPPEGPVLVLGVGNRRVTADALGPRTGVPVQGFCSSIKLRSSVLVSTLCHTADLAASGVLLDDTLSASLVDRGNSSQDGCVLVSGIRIDGSVCLLDDCFQVGLNGLVVSLLSCSLHDAVLLRFDVRHSFHLLGYL